MKRASGFRTTLVVGILAVAGFVVVGAVAVALTPDPEFRNYEIFPDMVHSPAYVSQSANPNFEDGITERAPVEGSIARGRLPVEGLDSGASEPIAPWAGVPSDTVVTRGQRVYTAFCLPCHGPAGLADGLVAQRGFPPPPSLVADNARRLSDGAIFRIVSLGRANMPSLAAQVRRDDRWAAIAYVRTLQGPASTPAPIETGAAPRGANR